MEPLVSDSWMAALLRPFGLQKLHMSNNVCMAMHADYTIAYVNLGWYRSVMNNRGLDQDSLILPIGKSLFDSIPSVLQTFFNEHFSICKEERRPWQHRYECSSPDHFCEYLMTVYPLGISQGFLVTH